MDFHSGLAEKVVLVTGGMGGIGRPCIDALLAHGTNVALTYAVAHVQTEVTRIVDAEPARLSAPAFELRAVASINACVTQVMRRWGHIDIHINKATVGSAIVAAYADSTPAQDSAIFTINAGGTFKMCLAAALAKTA